MKPKILMVDDDEQILAQMRWSMQDDHDVLLATNEIDAMHLFERARPPVTTIDLSLEPNDPLNLGGLRLLDRFLSIEPATRAIVITANHDEANAIRAMEFGAIDYYTKPLRLHEIKVMVRRAHRIYQLQQKIQDDQSNFGLTFNGMICRSKVMTDLLGLVEKVAGSDLSVLISGESGTGKEVIAKAIHSKSPRRDKPFIVVNCAAIPEHLLESELFGYEKGAFTGAHTLKKGKFELADAGTLFLDEIGELAPTLQVKLLRFLQDRRIERVGGNQTIVVDVRIIAATNRELQNDMQQYGFREDLYYRLKVVPIDVPPLRKRTDDIVSLAELFLNQFCAAQRKAPLKLSMDAERALMSHRWPGNVRELENLIKRAVVLSQRNILTPSDLGLTADTNSIVVNLKYAKQAIELDSVKKPWRATAASSAEPLANWASAGSISTNSSTNTKSVSRNSKIQKWSKNLSSIKGGNFV